MWSSGLIYLLVNPSFMELCICSWVSISGLHCVTMYVIWLLRYLWSCISRTSYGVLLMDLLGVMYVCPWYVARRLLVVPLPTLGWVVIVS